MQIESPLGALTVDLDDDGKVTVLSFETDAGKAPAGSTEERVAEQFAEYFRGERRNFAVQLAPTGTEFQRRVWQAVQQVPYGETLSYTALAYRLGSPRAVRAVAQANASNPIAILIPCHRIVGSDGSLTGYAGGLERKRRLLELEGAAAAGQMPLW